MASTNDPLAYLRPSQPAQSVKRPVVNSHGPATNKPAPSQGGPVQRPQTQKIFADGAKFSQANTAYNTAKGNLGKGFVRNPQSKTGWSWVDELGRMAESRPPARGERVISVQHIQKLNPNFLRPQATTQPSAAQPAQTGAVAPWLVGFTGGNGWANTTDGGWYNTDSGQYWKQGQGVPGAPVQQAAAITGSQYDQLYANLLKMFEGI